MTEEGEEWKENRIKGEDLGSREALLKEGPLRALSKKLEQILNSIKGCIRMGLCSEEKGKELVSDFLREFCTTQVELKIEALGSLICHGCSKYISHSYPIYCPLQHYLCYPCFKTLIREASDGMFGDSLYQAKCPLCHSQIPAMAINAVFGNDIYRWNEEAYENRDKSKFICGICQDECLIKDGITLDCDHRYCKDHLQAYLHDLITDRRIDPKDLCCPVPDCKRPIDDQLILRVIASQIKFWDPFGYMGNEVAKYCPFCDKGVLYIPLDLDEFECPLCMRSCCPQCNLDVHKNKTCAEFAKEKRSKEEEEVFQKYLQENQMKRCPFCDIPCFLGEEGCKFMTCTSPKCKGKKHYFCMLCGLSLTIKQHYSHYPNGPYKEKCNTLVEKLKTNNN